MPTFARSMRASRTVAFHTLGCKLNFSETATLRRTFESAGYARVRMEERPDVVVINTCSVTENADGKCRNMVRRAKSINPEAYVMVVGCYAQLKPKEIAAIPGVNVVLGANEKFDVLRHLDHANVADGAHIERDSVKKLKTYIPSWSTDDRTRAYLKVQDGCDYFCSFCTIPLARGRSRNAPIADTVRHAEKLAEIGVREIVLTGVNIGDFGQGGSENLLALIRALDHVAGIDRFRISSIEPNLLTDEIVEFVAESKKFVPHFHIPLQSGSDLLLERMRRKYRSEDYRGRVDHILRYMPDACIGADVIVGFPGEDEASFNTTVNFIKSLNICYLHVFTYSERVNTSAVKFDGVVSKEIRSERNRALTLLSQQMLRAFTERQVGKTRCVLWESAEDEGKMSGYTENYVRLERAFNAKFVNTLETVTIGPLARNGTATFSESHILHTA